ncbi:hypothetical protein [Aurantiacibacter gilvus]|uniref:Uncharacterized protein n=1 Tax=Aurantiacibacter gilvus TaxID=3139141 RepID=A0ABU9IA65_9SPHN
MIAITRRTTLKGTLALAATSLAPSVLHAREARPGLFLFDARFAASRQLAEQWRAQGVPVLDSREHDLGLAWRERIPQALAANPRIEGVTLWSDRFICETFGRDHSLAMTVADSALPGADPALRQWVLA